MIEGTKSNMQSIPFDIFGKVASYLTINELGILTSSCKTFFEYRNFSQLWDSIKQRGQNKLLKSLKSHLVLGYNSTSDADLYKQIELARQISKLETLQTVRWRRPGYFPVKETDDDFRLFRMEAHTMNTFLDRYLIIVGGWSESSENEITVLDGALLPECILSIPTTTSSSPRFRYGFSTVVYNNDLWVFGGCRNGGYSADCNDLYVVKLKFSIQPESEEPFNSWETVRNAPMGSCSHISATYSENLTITNDTQSGQTAATSSTTAYVPSRRAYHSAVCSRYNNKDVMVVFGGLHEQRPTNSLELMYFEHERWFSPDNVVGQPPSPRFGHSCLLASNGSMIFTGGSDGNDLWRNGKEFQEIYILRIIPSTVNDQLIWTKLSLDPGVSRLVPGRCHAAASIGDRMVFFGGGANISDDLTVLRADAIRIDAKEQEEEYGDNSNLLYRPEILRSKYRPVVRSSSVAAVVGPYWCMYGGWNKTRRELGDFWVLDLTAGMSPPAAARSVSSVHSNEMSRYIFEEVNVRDQVLNATDNYELSDQEDDEDDTDEFLTDGRGFINNIPIGQVFLAMLTQGLDFIPAVQYVQSRRVNEDVEMDVLDDDEEEFDNTLNEIDDDEENNNGNTFDRTQYAEIASDDEDENTE